MKKDLCQHDANASKIPEDWKSRNNGEHYLITNNINEKYSTEYMCMTVGTINILKFLDNLKLLEDKNVMIADSGATCD